MKKYQLLVLKIITVCVSYGQSVGDSLFKKTKVHTIQINFPQTNYWNLLVSNKSYDDAYDSSSYIPATVYIDGDFIDSVGIQFKGNSSYYNYPTNKKPFTFSFDEYKNNQKYDGLKNLNLNNCYQDPTLMREKLFLDFASMQGLNAPRANYAKLYINGTYWGLYLMVERVNKTFVKDRFVNNGGNLFKGDKGMSACADLKYHGSLNSYYNCYDLKTNSVTNNWADLINLTKQINTTSAAQFKDSLEKVLNTNSFIGAWAAYNMFVDFDSYPYRFVHNYYIYHNTATNKFDWIIWDASTAFGMDVPGTVSQIENTSILYVTPNATDRPLVNRMLADSNFKSTYLNYMCQYLPSFQPAVLNPKIDSIYNLIKADVYAETLNMYSITNFDNNINSNVTINSAVYPGLKSFIQNRGTSIQNELYSLGVNCSQALSVMDRTNVHADLIVFPNPANGEVNIAFNLTQQSLVSITLMDCLGKNVKTLLSKAQNEGQYKFVLDTEKMTKGLYFIKVLINNNMICEKLIIE